MQRHNLSRPAAAPFVKWAGGKTQLLHRLDAHVPAFSRYFEPFLGGGALFFHLASRLQFGAHLSDANRDLVNAYNAVKSDVEGLIALLERHERNYRKEPAGYYYRLRSERPAGSLEAAARFLTDHLQGDVYFRVDGPGHNLRRARNQIRLLELLLAG